MNKPIPVWVFLLCALLGALFTMVFGWSVKSTMQGSDRSGPFGRIAVAIASFPTLASRVLLDTYVETSDPHKPILASRSRINLSNFSPIETKLDVDIKGLVMNVDATELSRAPGWRILVGAFVIDDEVKNAALAISPELKIEKIWILTEEEIDGQVPQLPERKFIHGFDILNDGSVIFSFDGGISLSRLDACESRVWTIGGGFNHSVTLDENEKFVWTMRSAGIKQDSLVKVATSNGDIVRSFSLIDIIDANPTIDILEIRKRDNNDLGGNSRNTSEPWLNSPFHLNDVDPLPAALASRFDGFEAGDLLVSARSLNLIFVVDPDTLEIKWWRTGATRRQHDPDWGRNGQFIVFDNRMSRDFSRIVSISPKTYQTRTMYESRSNDFYSRIRGKQQLTDTGNLLITSAQEGRIFEVTPSGEIVLEFINTIPGRSDFNYVVSQAIWLPPDALNFAEEYVTCAS